MSVWGLGGNLRLRAIRSSGAAPLLAAPVLGLIVSLVGAPAVGAPNPPVAPSVSSPAASLPEANPVPGGGAGVVILAQIAGVVATQDGHPLPGALVSVFAADQEDEAQFAVTDEEGRFEVGEASPGLYSLRAYLAGFLPSPRAQVLVESGASIADTLLLQMAAISSERGSGTLSELRWLLQRGRRNVLKDRRAVVDIEEPWGGEWKDRPRLPRLASIEGEIGFFAASGSSLGLSESRGVDSGIAYTRFELPSTARGRWEAEARLLESALASWAANLSYAMEEFDGHQFSAGMGYQRHLYGGATGYRPPAAPILNAELLHEPQAAWDGAAFVSDDFSLGPASLSTGLTYRRFSYLSGHRGLAPRAVLEVEAHEDWTLVGGMAVRVDGPIGEDAALLSRVAHGDLLSLDPSWFHSEAAQRSTRYQAGLEYQASPSAALAVRVFHEVTTDQLLRSFESGPIAGGRFEVSNAGDYRIRGFAVGYRRDLEPVTRRLDLGGRVSWLLARVENPSPSAFGLSVPDAGEPGRMEGAPAAFFVPAGAPAAIHDLSVALVARLRPSGTRFHAAYRLIRHPGLAPARAVGTGGSREWEGSERTVRFDAELVQGIPFADWSGTEWELSLAVRDLFFRDMIGRSLLDEIAVAHAPRRIVGGLAVRF